MQFEKMKTQLNPRSSKIDYFDQDIKDLLAPSSRVMIIIYNEEKCQE